LSEDPIITETRRIEEDCLYTSQTNFVAATFYDGLHLWLGIPAALASAAATATIITDHSKALAGVLALVATLLVAIQTFVNPERRAGQFNALGAEYRDLQAAARVFRTVDYLAIGADERRARLHELMRRRTELGRRNRPSERAFKKAQKKIQSGDPIHTVDAETS
jgi:hypothetical protein